MKHLTTRPHVIHMVFKYSLLAAMALALARPARAIPVCPSTWNLSFSAPTEHLPDVDRTSDPGILHDMARELYEQCPRGEDTDSLLTAAAEKFIRATENNPEKAAERQEAFFWLGMVYASDAGSYELQNRKANSALKNFIRLTNSDLRARASAQVLALRLRSARQLISIAHYDQVDGRNLGEAGWNGASQRVKCFLNAYPGTTGDAEVRSHLKWLSSRARDFIHDYSADPRYDLAGMSILASELDKSLATPGTPSESWPTNADIDPTDADNPRNCYRLPSPIPGPEKFDFDFSPAGDEHRKGDAKNARERVRAVLGDTLPR